MSDLFVGLDFGTESVRAVVVDARGAGVASAVRAYRRGQIVPGSASAAELFPAGLPPAYALQDPDDWVDAAGEACREAMRGLEAGAVRGIGVDFTSCTMLPCRGDGTPLSRDGALRTDPHAWAKLWKHHGAIAQTERINTVARERGEAWLSRYGGIVGLEWLWPKILEVVERSPQAAREAEVWLEAGDWLVWQLIGAPAAGGCIGAEVLPRSTCQAGYKGLWSARDGWPSRAFLEAVDSGLVEVLERKLPGRLVAPGQPAGELCEAMAARLGLRAGIPVSAAVIDAHAGVPGAGVGEAGTLVMVMGTSGCHMLLGREERRIPGVAGVVEDGILPGFFGYETGQAAMGDAFDLVRRLLGQRDFATLTDAAAALEAGSGGVMSLDWFNGCRTPLMDGGLAGAFAGLTLDTRPEQVYRATMEGSAYGLRWIVDTLREGGVPVDRFVATGGLARRNLLFVKIVASVLGAPVAVHPAEHGSAQGAAILGALAAGAFANVHEAVARMAGVESALPRAEAVEPDRGWERAYRGLYAAYRAWAAEAAREGSVLRRRVH